MCRLLGVLSPAVISAKPWLVDSDRSLLVQSNVTPETAQREGWGIAWFDVTGQVHLQKGIHGAFEPNEKEHYLLVAGTAAGRAMVGHLRHASNPLRLPRADLLALPNSQPFEDGRVIFAHNGAIPLPLETRKLLGPLDQNIRGVNDSEVLFWLMMKDYRENGDPLHAYVEAQKELVRVWEDAGGPEPGPYSGLNVIFATGQEDLWAFCAFDGEHGTSLCDAGQPYYEMSYQQTDQTLVVASEPTDSHRERWNPLRNGRYLHARVLGGEMRLHTGEVPFRATLLAR